MQWPSEQVKLNPSLSLTSFIKHKENLSCTISRSFPLVDVDLSLWQFGSHVTLLDWFHVLSIKAFPQRGLAMLGRVDLLIKLHPHITVMTLNRCLRANIVCVVIPSTASDFLSTAHVRPLGRSARFK